MVDVQSVLADAGLTNPHVVEFVTYWAGITQPDRVEVVSASDDARLLEESLAAGELLPVSGDRYFSRSYYKDTARSEERTVVATSNPADKGIYNNWKPAEDTVATLTERMTGQSKGKTMYVIPYLMAPQGSPLEAYAAGVELTDSRPVVQQMIRMSRVGVHYINELADQSSFVKAVHVTGDLPNLGQGTADDQRLFATVADQRTILHFGSSYGGNALLGKIAHGLRQACYDGRASGKFLAEQFLLLGIKDKETGKTFHVVGGFPSASGKTNLSMTMSPDELGDRYEVTFYGDDIAWIWVDEDGKLRAFNPENGVFGVAKDTNEATNPGAVDAIVPGTGAIFTNVAYNEKTQDVWWEGKTKHHPDDLDGWIDWKGERIAARNPDEAGDPWAHPNSRFTTTIAHVPNAADDYNDPAGVVVDAIIFGGRTRDREPLIRAITDVAEGVYDGMTLGAEATFAAEGVEGMLRYDPMSMRPFMAYEEGDYAGHWLKIIGEATVKPIFAHVNWFQRGTDGHFLWNGYRDNVRALLWLWKFQNGEVKGNPTAVGVIPTADELNVDGMSFQPGDLETLLSIDVDRWKQEMGFREEHLKQFNLPEAIWEAHRRVAGDLDKA
ncbi:phosphoenolpyruvate carboxykinase [GTP] [Nocardioides baekrokdamisoli]|uniref:Phosphoenolpyruvate carboxykinase [GTP] n=1 Tax=Nocardioides baekrokdamisoli TaxID=1804624 RepID=A0A3G9ING1_9ACTN|nr:phosphoenolpyruvate carboxykinase (GTP) [Nocardioides baekrokdamisoli]BBH17575.1 phosphoenolpyruvate carboxykinase [GTP] [Nocardioides baekrokdamisoli]